MNRLDHEQEELEALIKGTLEINPGLESILRRKEVKETGKKLATAMSGQVRELLDGNLFTDIDKKVHPVAKDATRIDDPDMDYQQIWTAVQSNIAPLDQHKISESLGDLFILVFTLGGQDFLNKHNIPATFDLRNQEIISNIKGTVPTVLKGVDETTTKWVVDQISQGRSDGLSNADIADAIREKVPDTYAGRADRIVRTETSNMVGHAENVSAVRNGASHKEWVTVGPSACPICQDNEAQGIIGINTTFASGDETEPAHPNCMCVVEYVFTPFMGTVWAGQ